ncbi:hypothetical protein QYE76_026016 [Lolium multiflorum]|uniref:Uncharacterized protein n=1 Tax=Lolium multiflorum TaxID=4521 RepID=A0AAD8RHX7_LOLMU|nr:hypothetical protein QYE76_026016 [Lolium multiflorum]
MELNKDYDIGLIQQFYATVHFDQDEARTFRWMTNETLLESNLAKFGNALGYPRFPGVNANGWRCHDSSFAQTKEVLEHLYIKGWGIPGKSADLLPTWDIMLRVYRETIGPKGGNLDELHLYEVDLMANSFAKKGTDERLDVMDYIYNEMWSCVMEKKLPSFAPYIMKLIEDTWVDTCQTTLLHSIPLNITSHEVKVLRTKRHNSPIEDVPPWMRGHLAGLPSLLAACVRSFASPLQSITVSISSMQKPRSLGADPKLSPPPETGGAHTPPLRRHAILPTYLMASSAAEPAPPPPPPPGSASTRSGSTPVLFVIPSGPASSGGIIGWSVIMCLYCCASANSVRAALLVGPQQHHPECIVVAGSLVQVDVEDDADIEDQPPQDDEDELMFPELVDRCSKQAMEDQYMEDIAFGARFDDTDDEEKNENDDSLVLADYEGEDLPTIEWNREDPQLAEGTVFQTMMDCRNAITTYHILTKNNYEVIKSEPDKEE